MTSRTVSDFLIAGYILLIVISWSPFPWNIQWSELLFIVLFIYVLRRTEVRTYTFHPVDLLIVLYLLGSMLSFAKTSDLTQTSVGLAKRLYLALVYVVFCVIASRQGYLVRIVSWFALVASLVAAVGMLGVLAYYLWGLRVAWIGEPMPVPYLGEIFRLHVTFHSWELFGDYLTFCMPLLVGLAMESGREEVRRRWQVCVVLVVAASIFTVSHSLVGFFSAGLFHMWRTWAVGRMQFLRTALAGLCLALFVGINAISVVAIREMRYESGTNPAIAPPPYVYAFHDGTTGARMFTVAISYNLMSYYLLKKIALEAFWREPLTGVGLGRFHEETDRAYRNGKIHAPYRYMDPHSTLLGTLAETGVFGGVTLISLWVGFILVGIKLMKKRGSSEDSWIIRATVAGIIGLLVNSVNADVMNFRFLWVGFALVRGMIPRMVPSDTGTLRLDRSGRSETGYAPGA